MKRAAGPFEILEILGEGSFGTVCVARLTNDPLQRKVALKILKGAYTRNPKILNRTHDEARLLSQINHPNIVRVEKLMYVGGRPVVVMEHIQGISLDQLLLRFKDGLPASIAIELVRQTFLALHVAYNEDSAETGRPMRVIHRDIKPSNVLLSVHGEVKVVDFGIAKGDFEGREAETESVVMGSRPYMAPERLDGVSDDPTVDVYSSGMTLYELLTGRTMSLSINPLNHEQAMNRQLQYLHIEGMTPAAVEDLRSVIRRMCAYERDYRPNALEAARDLEQCLYSIDPRYHITLDEFARSTVLPIYESRPRIRPEDAVQDTSESEFIREVTNQVTRSVTQAKGPKVSRIQYVFLGAMLLVVLLLGFAASVKFCLGQFTNTGEVQVKLVIPPGSTAKVNQTRLLKTGFVTVSRGPNLMELAFQNGETFLCQFEAEEDAAVRYTMINGDKGALSVNDGVPRPCTISGPAPPAPDEKPPEDETPDNEEVPPSPE